MVAIEAEEDEDEQVAESMVTERVGPSRVREARQNRKNPDHDDRPSTHDGQVEAAENGKAEGDRDRGAHLSRSGEARLRHSRRPASVLVGAFRRVEVVVGEVRPDLDQDRAQERGQRGHGAEGVIRDRDGRPDEDGHDRRGQRPRPRRHEPYGERTGAWRRSGHRRRYGSRGKREKSGFRFSL